jgi:hypothetical protein
MHQLSKKFEKEHPDVAKRIQSWRQIHNEILNDVELIEKDGKDVSNLEYYGVLHADFNINNFCWDKINGFFNRPSSERILFVRCFKSYLHKLHA